MCCVSRHVFNAVLVSPLISAQYTLLGSPKKEAPMALGLVCETGTGVYGLALAPLPLGGLLRRSRISTRTFAARIKPAPSKAMALSVRPTAT
jgi:hypothetical protein